jgi:hypothetical protein
MRCWGVSGGAFLARKFAPAVVMFAGLATVTGISAASAAETNPGCHLQTDYNPSIHVGALLVVASPVSKTAITAMQAEVERIWGRYGVTICWLAHGHLPPGSSANVDVLVVVDSRGWGHRRPTGRNALGCFRFDRDGDSRPLITIFPQHAQRLAGALSARICGRRCLESWFERLHGTLLGRALAHEIGHYLLGPEHSPAGLMRAEIDPRDVLAGEPKGVSLTDSQVQRLTSR